MTMAVIQYTAVVNQIRGKLNGSVFNRSRNANTLQRKQQQSKGQKGYQSAPRSGFSFIQRAWKNLEPARHSDWGLTAANNPARDRFGDLTILSGYNQFIKANMFRHTAGLSILSTPDTSPATGVDVVQDNLESIDASAAVVGRVRLTESFAVVLGSYPPNLIVLLDVSLPVSFGVTVYHGRYVNLYGGLLTSSAYMEIDKTMSDRFPMPTDGSKNFIRVRVVNGLNGAILYERVRPGIFIV